ncbi:MAG: hypothetical protein A3I05_07760 [Deltaproteobacteria bacterium RIFCSPLOWO2_02_FULL_44_10]|nr:MAG: hypothetical protein A3C46_09465 [Deltaproteobacteria bacterium RIFCSPHIGHO2_02_FULL_44_16]OGQ46775.1 MAG: hypothetical protein A3I05_07760 [Deltaproteobacteria bacterium RIFCSPLOWO2_02_FULL_44_10]
MKLFFSILFFSFFLTFSSPRTSAQTPLDNTEDILEEEILPSDDQKKPVNEDEEIEEEFQEDEPPLEDALPESPSQRSDTESANNILLVGIDGVVTLSYVFENSPESFEIKYRIHLKGETAADTAVINGDAEIIADVQGMLATWPGGECKLEIQIPQVSFELVYKKTGEEAAVVNLRFKGNILEQWQSKCSFKDGGPNFETSGPPEKWLTEALQLASPPLTSIALKFDDDKSASTTFQIRQKTFNDPPIGSAQIEGTGIVTVKPKNAEE